MTVEYAEHVRSELALFLRTKRRRADPAAYGVVPAPNRRTAGLRREEVAELAGVGPTWYTWLEQGRDIRASARVLHNVASVLRLSKAETDHLFRLAGQEDTSRGAGDDDAPDPWLQTVVDQIGCPAFIRNARYDVLVWNDVCAAVFGFTTGGPALDRNFLWRLFRHDWPKLRIPDHQTLARACFTDFRLAYAERGMAPGFADLAAELRAASELFAQWWAEYPVEASRAVVQRLEHDRMGALELRFTHFDVADRGGMHLVVAAPERNSTSERKIAARCSAPRDELALFT